MLRLLRLSFSKIGLHGRSAPSMREKVRAGSPIPGGSSLITSAPQSASTQPAAGPATHTPSSTTRIPSSGPAMPILPQRAHRLHPGPDAPGHPATWRRLLRPALERSRGSPRGLPSWVERKIVFDIFFVHSIHRTPDVFPGAGSAASPLEGREASKGEVLKTGFIDYDASEGIASITLNRPQAANAQTLEMLDDLDEAWRRAAEDPDVRVIILQANGKHFSSGHDIRAVGEDPTPPKWTVAGIYEIEAKRFLEYSLRWRNVPKPSIAAVQGVCIGGGLLLCWPCDLIIAADNARFSDPVVSMGIGGVEYHGHTWEWGARKAKEMLFTGRPMTAQEAEAIGMVTRVVPLDELRAHTRALAAEIAKRHPFALRQAKRAVNQTLDVQGFYAAVQSVFEIHQNGHGHALSESGLPILMTLDAMKGQISKQ